MGRGRRDGKHGWRGRIEGVRLVCEGGETVLESGEGDEESVSAAGTRI